MKSIREIIDDYGLSYITIEEALSQIAEIIEGMKKKQIRASSFDNREAWCLQEEIKSYNSALSDVIAKIKEE